MRKITLLILTLIINLNVYSQDNLLEIENELKAGILSNLQQNELNAIAKKNGFRTMQDMGQEMLLSGDLSFAEYERVLQSN